MVHPVASEDGVFPLEGCYPSLEIVPVRMLKTYEDYMKAVMSNFPVTC